MSENGSLEWKDIAFSKLVKGFRGVSYRPENLLAHLSESTVTLLRATNIQGGKLIFDDVQFVPSWIVAPTQVLEIGDIVVCMSNGSKALVGKAAAFNQNDKAKYTIGAFCSVFKVIEKTEAEFVFHLFHSQTYQKNIDLALAGSAINNLKNSSIENIAFKLPEDKKQWRKIAKILTSIDTSIEKTEALIAKYQQIKAGLMHDLFTRGVLPNGQLRPPREQAPELYQETAIGWIPKEWNCERLGNILMKSGGYLQTGPFGSQLHANEYENEGIPVVMPQNINDGVIDTATIARITEARTNTLSRHRLKVGDIIIARRGELSRAAAISIIELNWICGTGCFLLRLGRTELNHFFFSHLYRYDFIQRQIAGMQVGTTMPSLNNSVMNRVFFPYPRVDEQNRITKKIDVIERKLRKLQDYINKLNKQKLGLMQDLLTGKVQVQVNEQEREGH